MLSVEEALDRLLHGVGPTAIETVRLADLIGRVPATFELVAPHDVPPFDNSAMDGFALRTSDGTGERRVVGESRAGGDAPPSVDAGTAVRIMTGAPMPVGADAVVPMEDATEEGGILRLAESPTRGAYVRRVGHDVRSGATVELPGAPLGAAAVGLVAALGLPQLDVRRRPVVAVLSTGDELVAPGEALAAGQIHDANAPALAASVVESGGRPLVLPRAADAPAAVEERLQEGAAAADLLVVSGGVSVGEHDHVRGGIERLGHLDFWRIAVQPGKPLAFGRIGERPVIGLPGNPVSALVTFELFVRPMLRRMLGLSGDGRVHVRARVDEPIHKDPVRRAYLRARVCAEAGGTFRAVSAGGQASSQLASMAAANALLVVPEGLDATLPGMEYEAIMLGAPG